MVCKAVWFQENREKTNHTIKINTILQSEMEARHPLFCSCVGEGKERWGDHTDTNLN